MPTRKQINKKNSSTRKSSNSNKSNLSTSSGYWKKSCSSSPIKSRKPSNNKKQDRRAKSAANRNRVKTGIKNLSTVNDIFNAEYDNIGFRSFINNSDSRYTSSLIKTNKASMKPYEKLSIGHDNFILNDKPPSGWHYINMQGATSAHAICIHVQYKDDSPTPCYVIYDSNDSVKEQYRWECSSILANMLEKKGNVTSGYKNHASRPMQENMCTLFALYTWICKEAFPPRTFQRIYPRHNQIKPPKANYMDINKTGGLMYIRLLMQNLYNETLLHFPTTEPLLFTMKDILIKRLSTELGDETVQIIDYSKPKTAATCNLPEILERKTYKLFS